MRSLRTVVPNAVKVIRKHAHHDAATGDLKYEVLNEINAALNLIERLSNGETTTEKVNEKTSQKEAVR